jgi:hypothetical protein
MNRNVDIFENTAATILIRKDPVHVKGEIRMVRRVFLRLSQAEDYCNVGWVLDEDVDACMLCGVLFGMFERRSHCRVCGDIVCKACCTATVLLKEFREWGSVPACDFCFYGQVTKQLTRASAPLMDCDCFHLTLGSHFSLSIDLNMY